MLSMPPLNSFFPYILSPLSIDQSFLPTFMEVFLYLLCCLSHSDTLSLPFFPPVFSLHVRITSKHSLLPSQPLHSSPQVPSLLFQIFQIQYLFSPHSVQPRCSWCSLQVSQVHSSDFVCIYPLIRVIV